MANQSNLALKGIIGIGAMSKISDAVGENSDSSKYSVRRHSSPAITN